MRATPKLEVEKLTTAAALRVPRFDGKTGYREALRTPHLFRFAVPVALFPLAARKPRLCPSQKGHDPGVLLAIIGEAEPEPISPTSPRVVRHADSFPYYHEYEDHGGRAHEVTSHRSSNNAKH
jgi:hypothetical protein